MQITKIILKIFILVCVAIFLSGCSMPRDVVTTTDKVPTLPVPTLTISTIEIIEHPPSQTPNVVPSATNTSLPDTPTFTSTASQTAASKPTWTPVPTLSQDARKMNLIDLFATNGGCNWPCWWGVQPEGPLQDVFALSSTLGESPSVYKGQYVEYDIALDELNFLDLMVVFYEKEGTVQKIKVGLQKPSRHTDYLISFENAFSLSSTLSKYGKPSDILLQVMHQGLFTYTLVLLYEPEGFAIEYYGLATIQEPIQICVMLDDYHLEVIELYFEDAEAMRSLRDDLLSDEYQHLEDVTSMDIDAFYDTLESSETLNCIETSIDHWE